MEENGKSFAMNVEQRKDALKNFMRHRRDFILQATGADRSRLDWTESFWNREYGCYFSGTDRKPIAPSAAIGTK